VASAQEAAIVSVQYR